MFSRVGHIHQLGQFLLANIKLLNEQLREPRCHRKVQFLPQRFNFLGEDKEVVRVASQILGRPSDLRPLKLFKHFVDQRNGISEVHLVLNNLVVKRLGFKRKVLFVENLHHLLLELVKRHYIWKLVHLCQPEPVPELRFVPDVKFVVLTRRLRILCLWAMLWVCKFFGKNRLFTLYILLQSGSKRKPSLLLIACH